MTRDGDRVTLAWVTGDGRRLPHAGRGRDRRPGPHAPMRDGRGEFTASPSAHILIDPHNKVLRDLDFIEVWRGQRAVSARGTILPRRQSLDRLRRDRLPHQLAVPWVRQEGDVGGVAAAGDAHQPLDRRQPRRIDQPPAGDSQTSKMAWKSGGCSWWA
jgi:hypothetical protein